ncbi:unnamed protein product [Zymoseptoria tritici ST99CH_3D1]|nr:unnamed protein product [Zymoseptoria tritici ST99CH_3D1]
MDSKKMSGNDADWNDMSMFNGTSQFDDGMPAESPFGNSAFNDFTNLDSYDSPVGFSLRTPSKSGPELATGGGAENGQQGTSMLQSGSVESSSQDSSSDSSSRRKRKTGESESPGSDPMQDAMMAGQSRQENMQMGGGLQQQMQSFDQKFAQPMHNLTLEQSLNRGDSNLGQFDYNSAASSPIQPGDFNSAMSLNAHVRMPAANVAAQFAQDSPVQTINPGMFAMGSRDQSPATANMMLNQASPHAIFSTPSSDSQETFTTNANWNAAMAQNPAWPGDFANQLTSPGSMNFTPSPGANGTTPTVRGAPTRTGRSPLHIAPISTKSRVETQINVVMTLEKPPPGVEHLHLPLHTIAKSKLLAKEDFEQSKVLELHTMLVCTSAMHNPQFKERALQRAALQNNDEIQRRAEAARESGDDDRNDGKNLEEAEKPANGGEVRICSNCIQRERKRAGRKKTKREEEQQHWERYETERVVVFNSNEYLPFKPCERNTQQRDVNMGMDSEQYVPPEGSMNVTAAMRIACYCRHQSEKEGFQVIFTLKDIQGNVVAQQMSDSILITDDHKTHPQAFSTGAAGEGYYQNPGFVPNGLPMSQSMVDMSTHVQPFTSSRSAGNLQAMAYGGQFNPHSHVHQLPGSGFASGTTSATMTPTTLSRPASPSNAGQQGPNKKRKSSSFHRKVASGLTMTPRVETSISPVQNMPSALSMGQQFSPANAAFPNQMNQPYMTMPNNNGPAQYFGSGPPTPNESGPFQFNQTQIDTSHIPNNQAYFSHPSSAVPSRASSPVLQQTRANMAAYARQQPIQTPTNSIGNRGSMYANHVPPGSSGNDSNQGQQPYPTITRITPNEGPSAGGTEVAVFGENLIMGLQVAFGDQYAPTQYVSPTSIVTIAPPGRQGSVHLTLVPPPGTGPYPAPSNRPIYRYTAYNEEMMVMALKFLSEQQYGSSDAWQTFAQQSATSFVQSRVNRAGLQQQQQGFGNRMAATATEIEDMLLSILNKADMSESTFPPNYDLQSATGATMLSLACCLGMDQACAALLARGANPDVRDKGGYTPLMHAAVHGRTQIFQLLVARGADASVRSLMGYSAFRIAPEHLRAELRSIVLSTQRRRHSRSTLQTGASYDELPSQVSWDVASASLYESEMDSKSLLSDTSSRVCTGTGIARMTVRDSVSRTTTVGVGARACGRRDAGLMDSDVCEQRPLRLRWRCTSSCRSWLEIWE